MYFSFLNENKVFLKYIITFLKINYIYSGNGSILFILENISPQNHIHTFLYL